MTLLEFTGSHLTARPSLCETLGLDPAVESTALVSALEDNKWWEVNTVGDEDTVCASLYRRNGDHLAVVEIHDDVHLVYLGSSLLWPRLLAFLGLSLRPQIGR